MATPHDLLSAMTLEEKVGQLNHLQGQYSTDPYAKEINLEPQIREGKVGAVTTACSLETIREWQRMAVEESRLGVPLLFANDVIHGFRTILPIPLGQAASWNLGTIERCERVSATEGAAAGLNWTFAPMVDIARDARWGRTMEGAGEDPCLGSAIARARVRGIQGKSLRDKDSLISCLKHYAAYGAAEAGREYASVDMSESRLREVYLPPFQAGVEEGARTVMNSFNTLNGVPASCHRELLKGILKGEWGFQGITVSDAFSFHEVVLHGVAKDDREAALLCFLAGSDTDLWPGVYMKELPGLVREGFVSEADLDEAVLRVLLLKEEVGLLDDPYGRMDEERARKVLFCSEHRAVAKEAAVQSFVLLKNEGAFPLDPALKKLAVIGPLAHSRQHPDLLGNWCAEGKMDEVTTILDGLKSALPHTEVLWIEGWKEHGETAEAEACAAAAAACDACVIVAGERGYQTGECASHTSISLPKGQQEVIRAVSQRQPKTVTLLACGRAMALEDIIEDIRSLLVIWQPGSEAGSAVADVLVGKRVPQGRLPVSFPRRVGQLPMSYAELPTGRPRLGPEDQRWGVSRYADALNEPLFPFGFGLGLSETEVEGGSISSHEIRRDEAVVVRARVANRGAREAVEVIQLYVRDLVASQSRPVRELKRFERIELAPGDSREVEFRLGEEDLRFWKPGQGWVSEDGEFEVFLGKDSTCPSVGTFFLKS